jgi:hypothetical protein
MASFPASILIKWAFHDFEEQCQNLQKGLSSLAGADAGAGEAMEPAVVAGGAEGGGAVGGGAGGFEKGLDAGGVGASVPLQCGAFEAVVHEGVGEESDAAFDELEDGFGEAASGDDGGQAGGDRGGGGVCECGGVLPGV